MESIMKINFFLSAEFVLPGGLVASTDASYTWFWVQFMVKTVD